MHVYSSSSRHPEWIRNTPAAKNIHGAKINQIATEASIYLIHIPQSNVCKMMTQILTSAGSKKFSKRRGIAKHVVKTAL
jgi:hypothetical protein